MKQRFQLAALLGVAAAAGISARATAASLVIDNFNEYTAGTPISVSGANATPYEHFGASVQDQLTANATSVVDGTTGADIPLNYAAGGFAVVARDFTTATPVDLSAFDSASIDIKSLDNVSITDVQLYISDGSTVFESNVAQAISPTGVTYTFPIDTADVSAEEGSDSLATVLSKVSAFGVLYTDTAVGADDPEFDNIVVTSPAAVPEPASAGLLGLGLLSTVRRRRRNANV